MGAFSQEAFMNWYWKLLWIWESLSEETETAHCYFLFLEYGSIAKPLLTKAAKCQYSHEWILPSLTQKLSAISVAAPVSRVPQKAESQSRKGKDRPGVTQSCSHAVPMEIFQCFNLLSIPDMTKSKDPGDFDPARSLLAVGDQAGAKEQASLLSRKDTRNCPWKIPSSYGMIWIVMKNTWHRLCENAINYPWNFTLPLQAMAKSLRQWQIRAIKFGIVHLGKTSAHVSLPMGLDSWRISFFCFSLMMFIITIDPKC